MTAQPSTPRQIAISLPSTGDAEWHALREPLQTGWLTSGPKVSAFENAFTKLHGVKHGLAVTSCTTGLHLALAAFGIGPGDEVIVPAFTWIATANVVLYCGATPVFVDVDPTTFNIDVSEIRSKLTDRTRAIIPVHLFGLCADVDAVRQAIPSNVKILEDAACAAGARYKGRPAGSLGDAAVFSFHPRKSITTGEGGMLTTNDDVLANIANQLRNHGATISEQQRHDGPQPYLLPDFNLLGFNYRMTDLQAAVGLVQLEKLEAFVAERSRWAEFYNNQLRSIDWLRAPEEPTGGRHAWQAYVCSIDPDMSPMSRNRIMEHMQKHGVSTRPGTHAVHMLNYYRDKFGLSADDFPNARDCAWNSMAIPLHNRMTEADYNYVVSVLRSI